MNEKKFSNLLIIFSRLLDYPASELYNSNSIIFIKNLILSEMVLNERDKKELTVFFQYLNKDIYSVQEDYVHFIDNSRRGSLYIFEHLLGESKDRGGAMVDLIEYYAKNNFTITSKELPDYLPLMLEFASTLNLKDACIFLKELNFIIKRILENFWIRNCPFKILPKMILNSINEDISYEYLDNLKDEKLQKGETSHFNIDLDKNWQEPVVDFSTACSINCGGKK